MVAMLEYEDVEEDLAFTELQTAYVDSTVTQHKVKDDYIILDDKILTTASIGTACVDTVSAKIQGRPNVRLYGGNGTVKLNCVLHVLNITQSFVYVSNSCENGPTVLFTER